MHRLQITETQLKRLLNVDEAVIYLSISRSKFYLLIADNKINRIKIGSRTLFDIRDLDAFIENLKKVN